LERSAAAPPVEYKKQSRIKRSRTALC